jgi:type I restriction enzyme S subunit
MAVFRSSLNPYLYYFLRSSVFRRVIAEVNTTTINQITQSNLRSTLAPIPPLAEQRRIVAKVDQLLALCDELEARQTTAREHRTRLVHSALDHLTTAKDEPDFQKRASFVLHKSPFILEDVPALRQAIRTLAAQGRLVAQSPTDEPASALLTRVRAAKRCLAESAGENPPKDWPKVNPSELNFTLPNGWAAIRLGDVAVRIEAGFSPQCEGRSKTETEWGVLKISAVSWDEFDPGENKALPANIDPPEQYEVRDGDFLMSRANTSELIAKSVIANQPPPRLLLNDKTLRVHFTEHMSKEFLNLVNNSTVSRAYYSSAASGTSSSMKNISREAVCTLPIALPPLDEQRRIVAKVEDLMRWCDHLETHLANAHTTGELLMTTALARISSGCL